MAFVSALLIGCSTERKDGGTPALFNNQEAAEKAAKSFNCIGAHKMGEKWMPCKKHGDYGKEQKHESYGSNHHH